jgi:hypothetical protein
VCFPDHKAYSEPVPFLPSPLSIWTFCELLFPYFASPYLYICAVIRHRGGGMSDGMGGHEVGFGLTITFGLLLYSVGRDSSVGIATRYGLDGPGIESWWGRDFPQPSRPALGPTHLHLVPGLKKE